MPGGRAGRRAYIRAARAYYRRHSLLSQPLAPRAGSPLDRDIIARAFHATAGSPRHRHGDAAAGSR